MSLPSYGIRPSLKTRRLLLGAANPRRVTRGPKTNIAALFGSVECVESREEPKRGERRRERSAHGSGILVLARGGRHEANPGIC